MVETAIRPKSSVRRFDVFAEYNRIEKESEEMPEDEAKGYGIWLAKVVASRRYRKPSLEPKPPKEIREAEREEEHEKWKSLEGAPQTDETFDHDVVEHMGLEFYEKVFSPAIRQAFRERKSYEQIRDSIRREWKPAR